MILEAVIPPGGGRGASPMSKWFSISQVCDSPGAIVPVASEPALTPVQSPVTL